jgi:3-oxoadipate enol-lactonase
VCSSDLHSLGCDHSQWDAQAADLQPHFLVLRYDLRGHGASDAPPGDYSIDLLAHDALAIADALGITRFAFCGLSIGGMIGQWLAVHAPDRLTHVVLANTSSRFPDPSVMEARRRIVLEQGMGAIEDAVLERFFTAENRAANTPPVANIRRVLLSTNPVGYAGCGAAVRDMNQTSILSGIRTPTLIIAGDRDTSTPWQGHGDVIAREIAHARVEHLPTAHLSNVERPHSFSSALLRFLLPEPADTGIGKRRTLLDDRARRLLALSAAAALGRWEEFRRQVRTGLERGLEPCDIEETLLQIEVCAGAPAARTGSQIAAEEMAKFQTRGK